VKSGEQRADVVEPRRRGVAGNFSWNGTKKAEGVEEGRVRGGASPFQQTRESGRAS